MTRWNGVAWTADPLTTFRGVLHFTSCKFADACFAVGGKIGARSEAAEQSYLQSAAQSDDLHRTLAAEAADAYVDAMTSDAAGGRAPRLPGDYQAGRARARKRRFRNLPC